MTIDLRSDTVTRPCEGMRAAMARAPVGDDQYGEDPSVNELQARIAALLGKEAALFVPSGTMANQIALRVATRPGDDVIVGKQSHAVFHETGASAANNGVQFTEVGSDGTFTADDLLEAIKPRGHPIYPPTTLVEVENTHNRGGGLVFDPEECRRIGQVAKEAGLRSYLDGARLFNAAIASGRDVGDLAAPFDLVSVALSKGLGAPAGSVIAGSRDDIALATRHRRMLGGAMRQAGILAAAGAYALDQNLSRLAEDHANAKLIARRLAGSKGLRIDAGRVATNIVVFHLALPGLVAADVVERCRAEGVLILAFSSTMLRLVTHLDVDREGCRQAAEVIVAVVESLAAERSVGA